MTAKKDEDVKILIKGDRIITRSDLFARKEEFHKEQARLPFEEKIHILVQLQKIAYAAGRLSGEIQMVWKIATQQGG